MFVFEPLNIAMRAERLDVIILDDTGAVYHIEDQRNLKRYDLYRFACYHFHRAKQWVKVVFK